MMESGLDGATSAAEKESNCEFEPSKRGYGMRNTVHKVSNGIWSHLPHSAARKPAAHTRPMVRLRRQAFGFLYRNRFTQYPYTLAELMKTTTDFTRLIYIHNHQLAPDSDSLYLGSLVAIYLGCLLQGFCYFPISASPLPTIRSNGGGKLFNLWNITSQILQSFISKVAVDVC